MKLDPEFLYEKCLPVKTNVGLPELKAEMVEVMKARNGVGLAANQVGINARLFIMDMGTDIQMCVNPKILQHYAGTAEILEGCLSLPGEWAMKERSEEIRVSYYDEFGLHHVKNLKGILAVIFQHESDHLNGKTIMSA
jgi:peptide deformylase